MILAGASSDKKISSEEVAILTLKCLKENDYYIYGGSRDELLSEF